MRWYNPPLGSFDWREVPDTDEEALSLLDGYARAEAHAAVYEEWSRLGADIMAALIRAGECGRGRGRRVGRNPSGASHPPPLVRRSSSTARLTSSGSVLWVKRATTIPCSRTKTITHGSPTRFRRYPGGRRGAVSSSRIMSVAPPRP